MDAPAAEYAERTFTSQDDLALYYREYGDATLAKTPLLCLAGLTRNSKDFHAFAMRHARARRVLAPDYRGRGRSAYDPDWRNYRPQVYIRDIIHLLAASDAHRVIVVGTSLGGLLAMALALAQPSALAAVVLHDVGPEVDAAGLARIKGYAGTDVPMPDWAAATARLKELFGAAWPGLTEERWHELTRAHFREDDEGLPLLDYDPDLGRALARETSGSTDLWPLFRALAGVPTLVIRGALSDILSEATEVKMAALKPDLERLTVANRGHVPLLDEPECATAIDDFISRH